MASFVAILLAGARPDGCVRTERSAQIATQRPTNGPLVCAAGRSVIRPTSTLIPSFGRSSSITGPESDAAALVPSFDWRLGRDGT